VKEKTAAVLVLQNVKHTVNLPFLLHVSLWQNQQHGNVDYYPNPFISCEIVFSIVPVDRKTLPALVLV
jgi:hypothetical protein